MVVRISMSVPTESNTNTFPFCPESCDVRTQLPARTASGGGRGAEPHPESEIAAHTAIAHPVNNLRASM